MQIRGLPRRTASNSDFRYCDFFFFVAITLISPALVTAESLIHKKEKPEALENWQFFFFFLSIFQCFWKIDRKQKQTHHIKRKKKLLHSKYSRCSDSNAQAGSHSCLMLEVTRPKAIRAPDLMYSSLAYRNLSMTFRDSSISHSRNAPRDAAADIMPCS